MKTILILGPGCAKCEQLFGEVQKVVAELELECDLQKIKDINEIMKYGVMFTPALVVDGQVKSSGKTLTAEQIKEYIA